jgi:transketolase
MNIHEIEILQKVANTVRALSADAIEKQQSGHPGLPLGAADIGALLFVKILRHNPKNPRWMGRDRFVLSAGHGSMFLYALLHLCEYDLSMDDIKNFRQLHSRTPGHPEFGETPGVETTTGPLGQGIAAGTGMAIAQKWLAARFGHDLFNSKIWILAGDGCMMEGISAEAGSLAGTLGLDNLVIIYDANDVSLDGPLSESMIEDTGKRYVAYGFNVISVDGYDYNQMEETFQKARNETKRPTLIIAKTIIGKYAPLRQGQCGIHGAYLGPEEMKLFKQQIGWPETPDFFVPREVSNYLKEQQSQFASFESDWNKQFESVITNDPYKAKMWKMYSERKLPDDFEEGIWQLEIQPNQPTRRYNEVLVAHIGKQLPFFVTGSADVSSCDFTWLPESGIVSREKWNHQQIKFGVREFCMAACAYGMQLYGMIQPVVGTFLVFSDYMRNAIRLCALMGQRVIFVYSHDSIMLAQDGPTHQPVEQLMSLRLMPNLTVLRPCDENESKAVWIEALKHNSGPVALCFTRQSVQSTVSDLTSLKSRDGVCHGAYLLYGESGIYVDLEFFASGSEVHATVSAAKMLEEEGHSVRVFSVPSWELFDNQPSEYRKSILDSQSGLRVSVEAGSGSGWQKFVGGDGLIISQETFGASAPTEVMADHFGFTAKKVYEKVKTVMMAKSKETV